MDMNIFDRESFELSKHVISMSRTSNVLGMTDETTETLYAFALKDTIDPYC